MITAAPGPLAFFHAHHTPSRCSSGHLGMECSVFKTNDAREADGMSHALGDVSCSPPDPNTTSSPGCDRRAPIPPHPPR